MIHPMQVCEIAGISYRQLQYWDLKEYVRPSRNNSEGQKDRRIISLYDVACYVAMANLRKLGYSIQKITRDFLPWIKKYIGESSRGSGWNMYVHLKTDNLFCVIGFLDTTAQIELFLSDQDIRDKVAALMCEKVEVSSDGISIDPTASDPPKEESDSAGATEILTQNPV